MLGAGAAVMQGLRVSSKRLLRPQEQGSTHILHAYQVCVCCLQDGGAGSPERALQAVRAGPQVMNGFVLWFEKTGRLLV